MRLGPEERGGAGFVGLVGGWDWGGRDWPCAPRGAIARSMATVRAGVRDMP